MKYLTHEKGFAIDHDVKKMLSKFFLDHVSAEWLAARINFSNEFIFNEFIGLREFLAAIKQSGFYFTIPIEATGFAAREQRFYDISLSLNLDHENIRDDWYGIEFERRRIALDNITALQAKKMWHTGSCKIDLPLKQAMALANHYPYDDNHVYLKMDELLMVRTLR